MDPTGDISRLKPCIIRGGEESLGGAAGDGAQDTLGVVEVCGRADSVSGDDTTGGREPDVGDSETAVAETRGHVESLFREADTAAGDADAESLDDVNCGGVFISGR